MAESRIAVVSGATGFLGRCVVKRLLSEGWRVRAVTSGIAAWSGAPFHNDVERYSLSDTDIKAAVSRAGAYFNCSVVYDRPDVTDEEIQAVNVELPLRIIHGMLAGSEHTHCVLADSFNRKFPIHSTTQPRYTASKIRLAEEVARECSENSLQIVLLLIEHMYGPNDSPKKILPFIAKSLWQNVPRIALTSGRQRRDFIHVEDVASAMMVAYEGAKPGVTEAGCGTGESMPLRDAIGLLHDLCGSTTELGFGDLPNTPNEILDSKADISWLTSLGWKPLYNRDRGFRELFETDSSPESGNAATLSREVATP